MLITRVLCKDIKLLTEKVLSLENKINCLKKLSSIKPIALAGDEGKKFSQAAVLVPLCMYRNELSLLYTIRSLHLKVNRGQVAFPGGMFEKSDIDLVETAVREAEEEIGISREDIDVWGPGPALGRPGLFITPVLSYVGEINVEKLKINEDEVESVFILPLAHLCVPKNAKSTVFRYESQSGGCYKLPMYHGGPARVWGLTALITHIILQALIPGDYNHKLKKVAYLHIP